MKSKRIFNIAVIISLIGHGLCLGMPYPKERFVRKKEKKDIEFQIEFKRPQLIPDIVNMGEQKKYKEMKKEELVKETDIKIKDDVATEIDKIKENVQKIEITEKTVSVEEMNVKDIDEKNMLRYQDMIKKRIQEVRNYPLWAKKQGLEGYVDVSFEILSAGTINNEKVERSSGIKIFDKESLATIRRAAPFPEIPSNVINQIQMQVRIVFDLK